MIPITAEAVRAQAEQTLESRFTFECSACGGHHVWSHRWATLGRTNHRIAKCTPRDCGPAAEMPPWIVSSIPSTEAGSPGR
jgi:hypothetical protein